LRQPQFTLLDVRLQPIKGAQPLGIAGAHWRDAEQMERWLPNYFFQRRAAAIATIPTANMDNGPGSGRETVGLFWPGASSHRPFPLHAKAWPAKLLIAKHNNPTFKVFILASFLYTKRSIKN
jgi:hypothetical protein